MLHRQRDGRPAEATLDFTLDVNRKLAGAELSEMDAIARAQSANLSLVVWSLRRELAGIINETVPNVHVDDALPKGEQCQKFKGKQQLAYGPTGLREVIHGPWITKDPPALTR